MMRKNLILILFICLMTGFPNLLNAQEANDLAEEVTLYAGQVKVFPTNIPRRIVIGNPDIADVTTVTDTEITVLGKAQGTTTFVFWDGSGEQDFKIRVFAEDLKDIKQRIDSLLKELNLPDIYTRLAESEGKVLLLGAVKTHQDVEHIGTLLDSLKDKIVNLVKVKEEDAVVDIDVQVLELNKDATATLGFTWPGSLAVTEQGYPSAASTASKFSTLFVVKKFSRSGFEWAVDALAQEGKARILSRPHLACQSGKEAELLVGGEKPIITTEVASSGGSGTNVEYKEFGIKLKIKPLVVENERIKLALNVEVSDVGAAETIGSTGATNVTTAKAYPLTKRSASTELMLNNGQTMVIGGLMKQKTEEDVRKTPGLGDVPLLGLFFRKKTTRIGGGQGERGDTELFITLTPNIIRGGGEEIKRFQEAEEEPIPEIKSLEAQDLPEELKTYIKAIQTKVLRQIYYPKEARDAGWQGTVKLALFIKSDGTLKDIKVSDSSGFKILDDAACEAVKKVAPFYALPAQLNLSELRIEIPVVFHAD